MTKVSRIYLDCLLMIAEAAIEYVGETASRFDYADMSYWLNRHGELFDALYRH